MATATLKKTAAIPMFRPIIEETVSSKDGASGHFEANKHLAFEPPPEVISMKEIGLEDVGISPLAVSQPFQLFSKDAVRAMRSEIFKAEVMDNCKFSSSIAACQLRGYSPKFAPFIYDAWRSPDTLSIISKIAGVDLIPACDFEIGHINLSVKSDEETQNERNAIDEQKKFFAEDEGIGGCPWEDDKPVVGWHTDSYPFVCVLMLSDCTDMVGGETALQTGNGEVMKVRGPEMGCAVVMQGRYITHQALRALGAKERITMVTSFRPKSPFVRDDSVLETVRPISNLSELYYEFGEYRLEIMEERLRAKLKDVKARRRAGKKFDVKEFSAYVSEQVDFLTHTAGEMIEEGSVEGSSVRGNAVSEGAAAEAPRKRAKMS